MCREPLLYILLEIIHDPPSPSKYRENAIKIQYPRRSGKYFRNHTPGRRLSVFRSVSGTTADVHGKWGMGGTLRTSTIREPSKTHGRINDCANTVQFALSTSVRISSHIVFVRRKKKQRSRTG